MLKTIRRWWVFYCKYAVPAVLLLFPLVGFWGALFPWKAGEPALSRYAAERPWMIGFSGNYSYSQAEGQSGWTRSSSEMRQYLLLSSLPLHPTMLTVQQADGGEPTAAESSAGWLIAALPVTYAFGGFCVWWFWLRPRARQRASPTAL